MEKLHLNRVHSYCEPKRKLCFSNSPDAPVSYRGVGNDNVLIFYDHTEAILCELMTQSYYKKVEYGRMK